MKISFYISSLSGGGAEKVLITLANRFAENNNEVHVISLEKRPQFYSVSEKVKLHKKNNTKSAGLFETVYDFRYIKKTINEIDADIAISFLSRCNLLVLLANLFNKRKVIVCDRNNPLREHSSIVFILSNLIYRRANRIVVQTNQIRGFYSKVLQKKIVVQENPLDIHSLYAQLPNKDIVQENTIISIGRLEPQKDFETLIKAFALISPKYPHWTLKIFGIGEKLDSLLKLTQSLEVDKSVMFCGRTQKPFYELKKAKVFVLSTHYEGFPNVLCEAMEAGIFCIASDCVSGPSELIRNGINGYLFQIGDVRSLSVLLEKCIRNEKETLGKSAHESVKRLYLDENMKGWEAILKEVYE